MLNFLRRSIQKQRENAWYERRGLSAARMIPTHMTEAEKVALARVAEDARRVGHAIEVGSYLGASTCYIASGYRASNFNVYCIDTWNNETMPEGIRDTYSDFGANIAGFEAWVKPLRQRSESLTRSQVEGDIGMVFLDGDHTYEAVSDEVRNIGSWVKAGGYLIMHDFVYFPGVRQVVTELMGGTNWDPIGIQENLIWFRRR